MLIRREQSRDIDLVDAVHRAAFPAPEPGFEPIEVGLVQALRRDAGWVPALSLVAEAAGSGVVIGHAVSTLGHLTAGDVTAVGLGPIGVDPTYQGRGAGAALVHASIAAADALGHGVVVLLGDPAFYRRFGFVEASTVGIAAPDPEWGVHFQARTLSAWTGGDQGTFRYAAPFDELG